MRHGLLWFNDKKYQTLIEKIQGAAEHYESKYAVPPTLCYVHPSMLMGENMLVNRIAVKGTNSILPNHFWIGVQQEKQNEDA